MNMLNMLNNEHVERKFLEMLPRTTSYLRKLSTSIEACPLVLSKVLLQNLY